MEPQTDGNNTLVAEFQYRNPVSETFSPEASNYKQARASVTHLATKRMRKGKYAVRQYQEQIEKGISDGTFVKLSDEEVECFKTKPHHFTFHSAVFSQNSATTKVPHVNKKISTCVPGKVTTISTAQVCPRLTFKN